MPPADHCPLCPTRPGREPSEIPAPSYDVVVFENRFPSFAQSAPTGRRRGGRQPAVAAAARGRAVRGRVLHQRPQRGVRLAAGVAGAHGDRGVGRPHRRAVRAARRRAGVPASRTAGRRSGSRCSTRTGRSTATRSSRRARRSCSPGRRRTAQRTGRDLLGDVLDGERKAGSRIVLDGEDVDLLRARGGALAGRGAPRAAPRGARHGRAGRRRARRAGRALPGPAASAGASVRRARWSCPTSPGGTRRRSTPDAISTRLHLQLFSLRRAPGKLKFLAGSESGMGAWINDATPEQIAERLRTAGS